MADLATIADVSGRWPDYSQTAHEATAIVRIADAAAIVRLNLPDIDTRIAAETVPDGDTRGPLAQATARVIADAVIRVLDNPEGARRVQETIGDKAYTLDYGDGARSGLFLTDEELAALQPAGGAQGHAIGTAITRTRPGWDPRRHTGHDLWWPTR